MLRFMILVARGEIYTDTLTSTGEVVAIGPSLKERMDAADRVLDRTVGKAPAVISVESDSSGAPLQGGGLESANLEAKLAFADAFRALMAPEKEEPEQNQADTVEGELVPAT